MPERIACGHQVLRISGQERDQEFVLGLTEDLDDTLIARIIHINVELPSKHLQFFLLRSLSPILVQHRLLEQIFRSDRWHLWSTTFPFSLDENLSTDVSILPQLLLLLPLLLLQLHFLLLSGTEFAVGLVRLSNEPLRHFVILELDLGEWDLLNQRG